MRKRRVFLAALCLTFLIATPSKADLPAAQSSGQEEARFQSFIDDTAYFLVNEKLVAFVIPEAATRLQTILKAFSEGDLVLLDRDREDPDILSNVIPKTYSASRWQRVGLLIASLAGYWFVLWWVGQQGPNKKNILLGEDGRYSKSKFQIALWFGVLIVSYFDTMILRWGYCENNVIAGIGIPDNLLLLSGFTVVTFAGAKAITTSKADAAKKKAVDLESGKEEKAEPPSFMRNLLTNNKGDTDLGDVQMLIVTLLAVFVYLALVFKSMGSITCLKSVMLPEVDTTLTAILGLGQGAYLGKKAGGRLGES